jgi:release factor glutamine methyltransferase
VARLDAMVARRRAGEPLQYVLGSWGFRTLDLMVDRRVLIPRPETEVVVGHALDELDALVAAGPGRAGGSGGRPARVVDLGTGSGAIALSVAAERPGTEVWATDASSDALDVARANLAGLGRPATTVRVAQGSWFDALPVELAGHVDLVISNPPYVAADEVLPVEVAGWEPAAALVAGPRGTECLEVVLDRARPWLARPGAVVVELAPDQAQPLSELARRLGYAEVEVRPDLAGRPRALVARLPVG